MIFVHFEAEIMCAFCHLHNDTILFLYCAVWMYKMAPRHKTWLILMLQNCQESNARGCGALPQQAFGRGAIAPIALMNSAPVYVFTDDADVVNHRQSSRFNSRR